MKRHGIRNDSTSDYSYYMSWGSSTQKYAHVGYTGSANFMCRILISAKTGSQRQFQATSSDAMTNNIVSYRFGASNWKNTTDNLTSVQFYADTGNFEAGTRVFVRKLF